MPGKEKKPLNLKKRAFRIFEDNPKKSYNYKQLSRAMRVGKKAERSEVQQILDEMKEEGLLEEEQKGKYRFKLNSNFLTGIIELNNKGFAFVSVPDLEDDIFIPPGKSGKALTGDEVKISIHAKRRKAKIEGEVVEVLKRNKTHFTGILEVNEKFAFLIPDTRKIDVDIFIPLKNLEGGKSGDKAIVEITDWPDKAKSPFGKVTRILGVAGSHDAEMDAIIEEFELPGEFSNNAVNEADQISSEITDEEISKRRDFRQITTFTIDPEDAKDFDDALSLKDLGKGMWEIGVHIADVSYYVKPGTALDEEALDRATSVYLVDRVIPMLPEKLSNKLCSLRPNEEKFTYSAVFKIDEKGNVHDSWFGRTIINSDKRFTYEEAQERIENASGDYQSEINVLNNIARELRKTKFEEGAISFETEEVKFELDENNKPLEVLKKVRQEAHMLIEDFMLLANKKVAEFIFQKDPKLKTHPFVYRVHDNPPPEKLQEFAKIARRFGYDIDIENEEKLSEEYNRLLNKIEGKPEQNLIESLAIRSMAKAKYTTRKSSHYGLSFEYYTHFTSPIRRYPDIIAHRLLDKYLKGNAGDVKREEIEKQCAHSSEMEIRAEQAERASVKFKQVEYMKERIGEEFDGIVNGLTSSSIFVELSASKCEGRVQVSSLLDDSYLFEEKNYALRGMHSNKRIQLGDSVRVKVMEANLYKREIEFELVDSK